MSDGRAYLDGLIARAAAPALAVRPRPRPRFAPVRPEGAPLDIPAHSTLAAGPAALDARPVETVPRPRRDAAPTTDDRPVVLQSLSSVVERLVAPPLPTMPAAQDGDRGARPAAQPHAAMEPQAQALESPVARPPALPATRAHEGAEPAPPGRAARRRAAAPAAAAAPVEEVVRVSIGRIEVRATHEAPAPVRSETRAGEVLARYLRERDGARR